MVDRKENAFPRALDWNLMRTFMVIVEQGSITLAAEAPGLQQPSLSNALKRLKNSVDLRQHMYRQYFGFFCGPSHPLFNKQEINLKDLQGEACVSFPTDSEDGALRAVSKLRSKAKIKYKLGGVSASLHEVRRMILKSSVDRYER